MGNAKSAEAIEYDLVIDINNISDGDILRWPISTSKWLRDLAQLSRPNLPLHEAIGHIYENPTNVVSIMGRFDRGKTFIINQLAKTKLPCGSKVQTKGLSFLCPKDSDNSNAVYLDTSGTNSPLQGSVAGLLSQPDWRTTMANKKALEYFISDLQIALSDVILLVFNELTFNDQELLDTIIHRVQQLRKQPTQIYVLHNYKDANTVEETYERWAKFVLRSYAGDTCYEKTAPEVPVMTLRITGENSNQVVKSNIYHMCLANHATNFGFKWNNNVLDWLRSKLLTQAQGDRKPLTEMILTNTRSCLGEYLSAVQRVSFQRVQNNANEANNENIENQNDNDNRKRVLGFDWTKAPPLPRREEALEDVLQVEGNLRLRKSDVHFDGHFIWVRTAPGFEPLLDVLQPSGQQDLIIVVDVPGFSSGPNSGTQLTVEFDNATRAVILRGQRNLGVMDGNILVEFGRGAQELTPLSRERTGGQFERTIKVPNANLYKTRIKPEDISMRDGQCIIILRAKQPQGPVQVVRQD